MSIGKMALKVVRSGGRDGGGAGGVAQGGVMVGVTE